MLVYFLDHSVHIISEARTGPNQGHDSCSSNNTGQIKLLIKLMESGVPDGNLRRQTRNRIEPRARDDVVGTQSPPAFKTNY